MHGAGDIWANAFIGMAPPSEVVMSSFPYSQRRGRDTLKHLYSQMQPWEKTDELLSKKLSLKHQGSSEQPETSGCWCRWDESMSKRDQEPFHLPHRPNYQYLKTVYRHPWHPTAVTKVGWPICWRVWRRRECRTWDAAKEIQQQWKSAGLNQQL